MYSPLFIAGDGDCMYSPLFTAGDGDCIPATDCNTAGYGDCIPATDCNTAGCITTTASNSFNDYNMREAIERSSYNLDNDDLYGAECSRMSQKGQDKIKSEKLKSLIAYFYNR